VNRHDWLLRAIIDQTTQRQQNVRQGNDRRPLRGKSWELVPF